MIHKRWCQQIPGNSEDYRSEESSSHRIHRVILIPAGTLTEEFSGLVFSRLKSLVKEEIKEQDSKIHS